MTNEMIIFNESQKLAQGGLIEYTGREIVMVDSDGKEFVIKETEPIHTYNAWREMGYQVKKGEKAIASFTIWKYTASKNEETDEEEAGRMFMKKASFFKTSQVERRTA